ncbi:hypothetical protein DERP_009026 [Dermatophagoides pteronyssinus]|uniref:Uncharacterized protein n=1 Tax=Dermatophagoides pteronyssinus TaxID=6956 RepID=A0ABQ8JGS1_DERPT|nr:hypothetical protein DERP_009026 [Dermatophagoides pteronyssinus]
MTFASKSEMKKNRITNTLIDQKSFMRLNNHNQTNKQTFNRTTFSDKHNNNNNRFIFQSNVVVVVVCFWNPRTKPKIKEIKSDDDGDDNGDIDGFFNA